MTPKKWFLTVCGISHKTSTTEQREPLQLGHGQIAEANVLFRSMPGVMESVIVSTCNRIEFYFVTRGEKPPFETVKDFYGKFRNLDISDLEGKFYTRKESHTASHLFRVSAGMDSMVFGENQILGQVKEAYSIACSVRVVGKVIHRLFHQAFRAGKQVRTDTEMGKGACSVSSAAVALLKARNDVRDKPSILFIGVNQMISLAASGLSKIDKARFIFANRTAKKAEDLAAKFGGAGYPLQKLPDLLPDINIVVTCTGSELPIITERMIDDVITNNAERFASGKNRLIIMDLAIPRDVEFDSLRHPAVKVLNLEDVNEYVITRQSKIRAETPKAEEIIGRRLDEFNYWFDHVRHEPIYNGLGDAFETIRNSELSELMKKLPPELRDEVDKTTRRMVNRLLQMKVRPSGE